MLGDRLEKPGDRLDKLGDGVNCGEKVEIKWLSLEASELSESIKLLIQTWEERLSKTEGFILIL
jgi:hypothetical protein